MATTAMEKWKTEYRASTRDAFAQALELSPDPLYESALPDRGHACLVCGQGPALSALRIPGDPAPVVPLCRDCSADWNLYGLRILRRIRPAALVAKLTGWYLGNPFRRSAVWGDLRRFLRWKNRMERLKKAMKAQGR